ncbi:MAG: FtsX-like permease family protein, partial [Caulobacteraceae bacterium]
SGRPANARNAAAALGLGVALLAAVVLIQSSLLSEVAAKAPQSAPSVVFTGIPAGRAPAFDAAVAAAFGRRLTDGTYLRFPFLTGRLIGVRGRTVERGRIDPADRWAWDNDITISAIGPQPSHAGIVAGRWWPADWRGPPQVALAVDAARGEGVQVGDTVTLAVLGTTLEARVAALRKIDLAGFGADFPVVVDAHALVGANLDQVAIAKASAPETRRVTEALGKDFAMVGVIDVREALRTVADLFDRLSLAIRGAASVAALAGVLVLIGAIAAGAPARSREAAALQALGADRGQIVVIYLIEFAAVGLIAGVAGVGLGVLAAWPVVALVFEADWSLDWAGVAGLTVAAVALAGLGGVAAAFLALRRSPASLLRSA